MKTYLLTVHLKSGNIINKQIGTNADLDRIKDNFDEELRQEIFNINSENEKTSIPSENVDFYELREYEENAE